MKTNLYKSTFIFLILALSSTVFSQDILVVTKINAETENPASSDSALIEYLEYYSSWNFDVISNTDFASFDVPSAYDSYDAIYISDVIGSSDLIPYKTAGYPIPCVTNKTWAVRSDRWGWIEENTDDEFFKQTKGTARTKEAFTLVIHDEDHFISNLYPADHELVWTTYPDSLADKIGTSGIKLDECVDGAINLGHFASDSISDFPSFWAVPEGSTVVHSSESILSNVVVIGTVDRALGLATEEYHNLIYWSFKWAMGDETVSVKSNTQNYDLSVWPNPTIGDVNFSFTLLSSGNARINIYNIAGKLLESIDSNFLSVGKNTIKLDFSDMAEGLYIYEIITENDFFSGKIIKN